MTGGRGRRIGAEAVAVAWVVGAGVAVLLPALVQGAGIYNKANSADLIDTIMPWSTLAWRAVHHGTVPLWNPFNALGVPLSFNWHSLTFSVPALVSYLFPLKFDLAVQLIVTVVIAGTGMYAFCRVLGLRVVAAAFAATAFELSGPFVGWLGLPTASVMAWSGWLFTMVVLVARGERRGRRIAGLAVVLACTIYASQPPLLVQLFLVVAVFVAVVVGVQLRRPDGPRAARRTLRDMSLGTAAGLALAAPLILPGAQILRDSINTMPGVATAAERAVPVGNLFYEVTNYAYLGWICVVLAVVGIVVRRRRPEVVTFAAVAAVAAVASMVSPVLRLLQHVPLLGSADWSRATFLLVFALAVLAGHGVDALAGAAEGRTASRAAVIGFAALGVGVLAVLFIGSDHITHFNAAARPKSVIWRGVEAGTGLAAAALLAWAWRRTGGPRHSRRGRLWRAEWLAPAVAVLLIACEGATLIVAGTPEWLSTASSQMPWGPNPAISSFQKTVDGALVGFGRNDNCFPGSLGILQNINATYKVHEFSVYDRSAPAAYIRAWKAATGRTGYITGGIFCPAVTSDAVAKRFGVSLVLEPAGAPGPTGGVYDGRAGFADYYGMPDAYPAVVAKTGPGGRLPGPDVVDWPATVDYPNDNTWRIQVGTGVPAVLRIHLTDVPGWRATIDGRPLRLERFSGIMLQARIPPGSHLVVLRYWPQAFTAGIVLALCALVAIVAVPALAVIRRRPGRGRMAAARVDEHPEGGDAQKVVGAGAVRL